MKHSAYWISPNGVVIPTEGSRHIDVVTAQPSKFGLTRSQIEKLYKKYDEPYGSEGQAREVIISSLLLNKWIRIRYHEKDFSLTIQLYQLNKRTKNYIYDFLLNITNGEYDKVDKNIWINILNMVPITLANGTIEILLRGKLFENTRIYKTVFKLLSECNEHLILHLVTPK
jgi:hypothetical protein